MSPGENARRCKPFIAGLWLLAKILGRGSGSTKIVSSSKGKLGQDPRPGVFDGARRPCLSSLRTGTAPHKHRQRACGVKLWACTPPETLVLGQHRPEEPPTPNPPTPYPCFPLMRYR